MEKRKVKISKGRAGGTAKGRAESYRISLPTAWVRELKIDEFDAELLFDGKSIVIRKSVSMSEFLGDAISSGHSVKKISYYDRDKLCAIIVADYTEKDIAVENYSHDALSLPFGNNSSPTWDDYLRLLSERCISRDRFGIREYLETIGVEKYDPLEIIKKTKGRMAEDGISLIVEEYEKNRFDYQ